MKSSIRFAVTLICLGLVAEGAGGEERIVFITSSGYIGDLVGEARACCGYMGSDGLEAGDSICQHHANQASLTGTFRAWLSSDTINAVGRFAPEDGPWFRTDGAPVAEDAADLVDCYRPACPFCNHPGCLENPINRTELGQLEEYPVWTGTWPDGRRFYPGDTFEIVPNCHNWTDNVGVPPGGQAGYSTATDHSWTRGVGCCVQCSLVRHLYCFETDNVAVELQSFAVE